MTCSLHFEEPAIGGKADGAQLWQVVQTLADAKVVGVVDGGLGAQGPAFLVILLDMAVFVIDVQRWGHPLGDDAGPQRRSLPSRQPSLKDELNLLGTAQIEVLADHLLEELSATCG